MAVPGLGPISLRGIRNELYNNDYNGSVSFTDISLEQASIGNYGTINTNNSISDRPDTVSPHAMSEFYSYDHDKAPPGTTPVVSTSSANWSCKGPGTLNMFGTVATSTSGHAHYEYGFVYAEGQTPQIGNFGTTKQIVGTSNYNGFYSANTGSVLLPCCCISTDYHVRAYAINAIGTSYGSTVIVTVLDCSCGDAGDGPDGPGGPI